MANELVEIKQFLRRMRGGSQAQLVECDDGFWYVAKFANNPQGSRTLVNEWMAQRLYRRLQIATPELRILKLNKQVRSDAQDPFFHHGTKCVPINLGLHLGSRCPTNPSKTAVYDFLPSKLMSNVVNLSDFAKAFVADVWLGQSDRRQAIFVSESSAPRGLAFRAYFIDHGMLFGGASWKIHDFGLKPVYHDTSVYRGPMAQTAYAEAIRIITRVSENELQTLAKDCPAEWLADGDRDYLKQLCYLVERRAQELPLSFAETLDSHLIKFARGEATGTHFQLPDLLKA